MEGILTLAVTRLVFCEKKSKKTRRVTPSSKHGNTIRKGTQMTMLQAKRRRIGRSIVERNTNLGAAITAARLKYRLSQQELAERLAISVRTLGRYEAGTRVPPAGVLEDIARETKSSTTKLLARITSDSLP